MCDCAHSARTPRSYSRNRAFRKLSQSGDRWGAGVSVSESGSTRQMDSPDRGGALKVFGIRSLLACLVAILLLTRADAGAPAFNLHGTARNGGHSLPNAV